MTFKMPKAPPAGDRGALGIVVTGQVIDGFETTTSTQSVQQKWVARRFGLSADRAYLIASLAFGRAA